MRDEVWYSGSRGLPQLAAAAGSLRRDLDRLRRGWRWDGPRPQSWAPASTAVPERESDLGWARLEPVRSLRYLIQRWISGPFTELMTHPKVVGREWVEDLDRPHILAANHQSHADTTLLLHALSDRTRERTVVAAAADYWYKRPLLGRLVSLWLNTFPFSRTGGAQAVLHSSSQLLKSGWHLLVYPEGTRSPDGRLQEFKPGVGHLATETRTPVVPIHVTGSHRVMPKGQRLIRPAPVEIRIGKPLHPRPGEPSRAFAGRVEQAVRSLAEDSQDPEVRGSWIERWRTTRPRSNSPE
ncbi:MAG TPA: lysophospholipid acyltransferase family protein [Candidatus Acidoferrales bacterium]|nr:lysophospholipid acyltransferase family protein [Candidatus Acidoferrales bacterium]